MFSQKSDSVTEISSYSFFVYLLFILIGLAIELFAFSVKVFSTDLSLYVGFGVMFLATALLLWVGHTGRQYRKQGEKYHELNYTQLKVGAFRLTRNPHYLGIGFLFLGFGLATNSFAIVVLAGLSFLVVNLWFIPHEETVLAKRHGGHFEEYKKTTKRWF
jgi:protein-S-isoprenylcysteine O-methyltransferase Ste14